MRGYKGDNFFEKTTSIKKRLPKKNDFIIFVSRTA